MNPTPPDFPNIHRITHGPDLLSELLHQSDVRRLEVLRETPPDWADAAAFREALEAVLAVYPDPAVLRTDQVTNALFLHVVRVQQEALPDDGDMSAAAIMVRVYDAALQRSRTTAALRLTAIAVPAIFHRCRHRGGPMASGRGALSETPTMMTTPSTPPHATSPSPGTAAPAPTVQVPCAPAAPTLKFYVHAHIIRRNDLNDLGAEEGSSAHYGLRLGIGYDHRIYTVFELDVSAGVLRLAEPPKQAVTVSLTGLSVEELAALRFLAASTEGTWRRRSHGWRAHVVEQLGAIVPIVDFDDDPVDPPSLAAHFRRITTLN